MIALLATVLPNVGPIEVVGEVSARRRSAGRAPSRTCCDLVRLAASCVEIWKTLSPSSLLLTFWIFASP